MLRRTEDIMVLLNLWNSMLFMLTTVRTTGSTVSGTEKDIMHAIAGNPFIIRTWPMIGSTLYFTVKKDNNIILDMSMVEDIYRNSTDQNGRMMLIYNQTIRELTLLFENVSKEDGGIYEMKESFYKTNTKPNETETDTYDRKDGTWCLEIYVLGPGVIKHGYVGVNISMEFDFEKSATQSTLYNYDEKGALVTGSTCSVLTDSSLYGRLRCAAVDSGRKYKITIVNVSQRDAGLYKVGTGGHETGRCFFSIEESPTRAVVGDNMTIGWFYNQQGIKRTLRVIHPNQGVMMLLHQTNYPQIKINFQHRLLYKGDILQSFMSFTLLNVGQYDAGLYTIETLHGNTIPGSKELNVEGTYTRSGGKQTTLDDGTTNISVIKQEVVTVQPMERQYSSSTRGPSLILSAEILDTEEYTTSLSLTVQLTSPANHSITSSLLVHVIYVVIGAMGLMIIMIGCLIWMQRSNTLGLKAVQRLVFETSSSTLNSAPFAKKKQLPTSILGEEGLCGIIRSTSVGKAENVLKFCSNPDKSLSFDTPSSFSMSVPILEDDKPGLTCKNIVASKESNKISIQTLSYARDNNMRGLLEDCPTVCILDSAASNAAVDLRQHDQFPYYPYAKVKKGPRSTFTNNNQFAFSSVPYSECSDGYNIANFTRGNVPRNTFQNQELASESTIPVNVSLQEKDNARNNYVHDAKDDDGYETCGNIELMTFIEHVKVSEDEGAMTGKDQEPTNRMLPHSAMHSDYADINI